MQRNIKSDKIMFNKLIFYFFFEAIPLLSHPPNPRSRLTVQAVFKEDLFCLKKISMRVEGAGP